MKEARKLSKKAGRKRSTIEFKKQGAGQKGIIARVNIENQQRGET
jgi:hypothetical protein